MKKVLIADDEHKIVMALEYSFKKHGYEVYIARDGMEVMELLKAHIPDVILLDIMMPRMDGFATLKGIKRNKATSNCKVVFLSAKDNPSDIEQGIALGADAYITKPYSVKKLMKQIEEMLET
jgi:two-component system, OmpR family, alkaline phosphatase synthesis response regulator PhoP